MLIHNGKEFVIRLRSKHPAAWQLQLKRPHASRLHGTNKSTLSTTLYSKINRDYTSASYYKCSSKELIYYMEKKQLPDSIKLNNYES